MSALLDRIRVKNDDLKAVNPHAKADENIRAPRDLLALIEAKGREGVEALSLLRSGARG